MKNILVLGGSGFVGASVCEQLVRAGHRVTVPTRRWNNARSVLPLPFVTVLEMDVHDSAALTRVAAGHDAVVNLVAILHGDDAAFKRAHVDLPQKIADACYRTAVGHIVQVSALGADPSQPHSRPSRYLRSKSLGEASLLANAGRTALTVLRPSVVFGAHDRFLNVFAALQKVAPVVPLACAQARFQPVWVEDLARAIVLCLQQVPHKPRTLEACGPEVFTLAQLVQLAGRLSGANAGLGRPVLALPQWAGYLQARLMELKPGEPLLSRDNLGSMQLPNVATPGMPGLQSLGLEPAALEPIARDYLSQGAPWHELLGVRRRAHRH